MGESGWRLIPLNVTSTHRTNRGLMAIVDEVDAEALLDFSWTAKKTERKGRVVWHARRWTVENGVRRIVFMHRQLLGITDRSVIVDHRNGDGLDNRRSNLRPCSHQENLQSRHHPSHASSGLRGVFFHSRLQSKPWSARIMHNRKSHHLGYFASKEEAYRVFVSKARELFGEFANV